MRPIAEIKLDIAVAARHGNAEWVENYTNELRIALTASIPLDRLEALCAAEKDGRCVVPCKVGAIDLLKILLCQLEKEEKIISKERSSEYKHLSFGDGRTHTLMRVKAWANTQLEMTRAAALAGKEQGG